MFNVAELILHPGCPKTGSSSIQSFLFSNREKLLGAGFYIPTFLQSNEKAVSGRPHMWASLLSFDEQRVEHLVKKFISIPAQDLEGRRALRAAKLQKFHEKLQEFADYTWIISDEILAARMLNERDLLSLKSTFVDKFDECRILFFLRNQLDSAVGAWSTALMNGSTRAQLPMPCDLPEGPARYLHHQQLLTRWSSILTGSEFVLSLYGHGDLIKNFANMAGFNLTDEYKIPRNANVSLSACCMGLLAHYNKLHPHLTADGLSSALRRYMPIALRKAFSNHSKYRPSKEFKKAYQDYYADSNEWVRATYFPHLDELWPVKNSNDNDTVSEMQIELPPEIEDAILELINDLTNRFRKRV